MGKLFLTLLLSLSSVVVAYNEWDHRRYGYPETLKPRHLPSNDTTGDQLIKFKRRHPGPIHIMTTSSGYPIEFQDTQTINSRLIFNDFFMESLTHLNRERIPERIVHAKGTGAFGYFKVTHDLSDICKAKVFSKVGKVTQVTARFSNVFQGRDGNDLAREARGFAVKFYTEEGNYDFVGLDVEMFPIKDPILFPTFVHVFRKNPKTLVTDSNMIWDFLSLHPETLHNLMRIFGDAGIPNGYRYMPASTIHTFDLTNEYGNRTFGRFSLLPDAGIRNLTTPEAKRLAAEDLDYSIRDLYNAIDNHNYPTWTLYVQTIAFHQLREVEFDIFDTTHRWPLEDYPLRPVGKLVLNKNPENQFADIEQLAFNPGNLVPGIRGVDTLFEARKLSYRDAQNYRLGANYNKIRVNCPLAANTYNRDGRPPVKDNSRESPNYYPNSFNGPVPYLDHIITPKIFVYTDPRPNNFDQAGDLYMQMTAGEKCRLVQNIVASLSRAEKFIQSRAVKWYEVISLDLGTRIERALHGIDSDSQFSRSNACEMP